MIGKLDDWDIFLFKYSSILGRAVRTYIFFVVYSITYINSAISYLHYSLENMYFKYIGIRGVENINI